MQFLSFRSSSLSPQAGSADSNPLHQLLSEGLQHPLGSLDRQRLFSQLMVQMQASGQIWAGEGIDPERYTEVLANQWLQLCQSPECFLHASEGILERFNQGLRDSI